MLFGFVIVFGLCMCQVICNGACTDCRFRGVFMLIRLERGWGVSRRVWSFKLRLGRRILGFCCGRGLRWSSCGVWRCFYSGSISSTKCFFQYQKTIHHSITQSLLSHLYLSLISPLLITLLQPTQSNTDSKTQQQNDKISPQEQSHLHFVSSNISFKEFDLYYWILNLKRLNNTVNFNMFNLQFSHRTCKHDPLLLLMYNQDVFSFCLRCFLSQTIFLILCWTPRNLHTWVLSCYLRIVECIFILILLLNGFSVILKLEIELFGTTYSGGLW